MAPNRARPSVPALYVIADRAALLPRRLPEAVEEMASCGVRWIQLRAKGCGDRELVEDTEECCRRLEGSGAILWVDDRVDLAALFPVSGVHLGQDDLPAGAARRVVGDDRWIGWSTHSVRQVAAAAVDEAVDVVAVGPVFPTASKEHPNPVVGTEFVAAARHLTGKPLVAIGGVTAENLHRPLEAGADAVAVLGAACHGDVSANCRRLLTAAGESR